MVVCVCVLCVCVVVCVLVHRVDVYVCVAQHRVVFATVFLTETTCQRVNMLGIYTPGCGMMGLPKYVMRRFVVDLSRYRRYVDVYQVWRSPAAL